MDLDRSLHHINKIQILASILLLIGLIVLVYLSQHRQILKPRAENNIYDSFEVTDTNGTPLEYNPGTQRVYKTDSLDVKIKIRDIQGLVP